jgi:hypothetical protein
MPAQLDGPDRRRRGLVRELAAARVSRLNQARLTIVSTSWVESEVRGRDAERQVALDPARVPQAKLVADERSPAVGEQVDAVEPGCRPDGRSTAAASGLRHCTCRGRGQPNTAAVGGQICNAGCTGCPGRHQPGPNRQRCRRKAGASWRPSWAPAAAVPSTTVAGIGNPAPHDLARPVLPGRARRGSGRGRRSYEHR